MTLGLPGFGSRPPRKGRYSGMLCEGGVHEILNREWCSGAIVELLVSAPSSSSCAYAVVLLDVGAAESIDRLLAIARDHGMRPDAAENLGLHGVGILKFIDEDVRIPRCGNTRRPSRCRAACRAHSRRSRKSSCPARRFALS